MKNLSVRVMALVCFLLLASAFSVNAQKKMKPDEVVSKHLVAIGSTENREAGRGRIISGNSFVALVTGGAGRTEGPTSIMSRNNMVLIKANFRSPAYPLERMSFDGKKLSIRQYRPGLRSPMGDFFLGHAEIFKEGLIGGVLSSAWPLLNMAEKRPRLKYKGRGQINGRKVVKLGYKPRKRSELKITLYFDAETFRHVRTHYYRTVAAQMGANPSDSKNQRETRFTITEDFSNFVDAGGLTLPKHYTIQYDVFSRNTPLLIKWTFDFTQFAFNQSISPKEFIAIESP